MKITFLGTGTSQGVPLIGCQCAVCKSINPKDNRLRSSLHIQSDRTSIVIDTGPDFRQQMLRENILDLDAVLFTHAHKDHIAGLDDIRAYNYILKKEIEVFANDATQEQIKKEFSYIFREIKYPGIPQINLNTIESDQPFTIGDLDIIPIDVMHYKLPVLGFRINNFTYITDANYINDANLDKIKGSEVLVLNALRHEEHISHFTLQQAQGIAQQLEIPKTYFTHISHQLGLHTSINSALPENMNLAFDGLVLYL